MYDPLDPFNWIPNRQQVQPDQEQLRRPIVPLSPGEQDSLLGKIAGAGLGGLGYVGSVLEKTFGGRAIRGALGGKPRELLSVLPFSDTLGVTDEADRVSGRDLLRNVGLAGDEDTWGNFLGGMGVELALDPGMYMTFGGGALTRAGQVAKKAGILPETVAGRVGTTLEQARNAGSTATGIGDLGRAAKVGQAVEDAAQASGHALPELLHQPLGYSVGFGLPFANPVTGLGESGLQAASAVKQGLGMVDKGIRSVPVLGSVYGHQADLVGKGLDVAGRYGRALFSPEVMGATSHVGQEASADAFNSVRPLQAQYKTKLAQYGESLRDAGVDPSGEILRRVLEGSTENVHPAITAAAQGLKGDFAGVLRQMQDLGIPVNTLADLEVDYAPRYLTPLAKPTSGYGRARQPLVPVDPRLQSRADLLKNVPGGTEALNRLAVDPLVHAGQPLEGAAHVRRQYLGMGGPEVNGMTQAERRLFELRQMGDAIDPALRPELEDLARRFDQGQSLNDWARGLDPQYAQSGKTATPLKLFGNHPLADAEAYFDRVARVLGAGDATQNLLARAASNMGPMPPGAQSLTRALESVGLTMDGAQPTLLARLNGLRANQGLAPLQAGQLGNFYVGKDVLSDATRYLQGFRAPEAVGNIAGAFDAVTNLTKAYQTAPWPAFHARNLISGLWQNWVKGMGDAPGGYLKQVQDAYKLVGGEVLPDAAQIAEFARRGLTPEQATAELAREMYAHGIGGHLPHLTREVLGPSGQMVQSGTDLEGFLARIPGEQPRSLSQAWQTYRGAAPDQAVSWLPHNVSGVGANADLFPPVAGGRQAGDVIEGVNRGSLFLSLRRQGYTAEQAAKEVLGAHFDYTRQALTDFEADVMRRVMPFYRYTRSNLPFQLEQLLTRPGGAGGTLARVVQDLRQEGGFLPDYLGTGLAIPVGGEANGTQRYLTRLDLPPEQGFEFLHGGPKWAQNTLMSLLGQTNPALKAPVEFATGKQFFTGRDLGDLYTTTGSSTVDQILANSPLSRAFTTARTLSDPRKYESPEALAAIPLNLATGVRFSDVDMERQRNTAAREYVKEVLQGQPAVSKFESLYLRPGMEDLLTPAEWQLLRLNKTLQQQAQTRK